MKSQASNAVLALHANGNTTGSTQVGSVLDFVYNRLAPVRKGDSLLAMCT